MPEKILLLSIFLFLRVSQTSAERPIEHPYIEAKDIKPETCLTCHPEKRQGKFVHTAARNGCENCHQVVSEGNRTGITLVATGAELCAKCHEVKKGPVLHGPYENGQCLLCHDPHSSEFEAQTRSAVDSLCLECHAPKHVTADTISLFGLRTISKAEFEVIPKIELDPTWRIGHPRPSHPVAGIADPLHGGEAMSCLSCHDPHASTLPDLIVLTKTGGNVCDACHGAIEKQNKVKVRM
jgi:predicted CXXCH cytochrome family protein